MKNNIISTYLKTCSYKVYAMDLILRKMSICCFKKKILPSFQEYMYEKDISKESWKANIKYFFNMIKLQWLPNYDGMMEDI